MAAERSNRLPSLAGSVALHALVIGALLVGWPWGGKKMTLSSVPVTLVAEGPTNVRPAVQAPEEAAAQTEEPVPDAPVETVAPSSSQQPQPAPTQPNAAPPKPSQRPTPSPKSAPDSLDLDALAASVAKAQKPSGRPRSSAQQGPGRPETAVQARPAAGAATGLSASALGVLAAELQRRWNPNCEVEGGRDVNVKVQIAIGGGGRLAGRPEPLNVNRANPVEAAAADRAVRAVYEAAPFENLPPEFYGQRVNINFNARSACG